MSGLVERLLARRRLPSGTERRAIREAVGASVQAVADELGTSPTSVIRWERGGNPRRLTTEYADLLDELRKVGAS